MNESDSTERTPWWREDGAPTVHLECITGANTRTFDANIVFSAPVRNVELRTRGVEGGNEEWFVPEHSKHGSDGPVSVPVGHLTLPEHNDDSFEIETRFTWNEGERRVVFQNSVAEFLRTSTASIIERR